VTARKSAGREAALTRHKIKAKRHSVVRRHSVGERCFVVCAWKNGSANPLISEANVFISELENRLPTNELPLKLVQLTLSPLTWGQAKMGGLN